MRSDAEYSKLRHATTESVLTRTAPRKVANRKIHPQIFADSAEQQSRKQSERSTNPHETTPNQVWCIWFRENSCDFVDRYVPSKLFSNNKKLRHCFPEWLMHRGSEQRAITWNQVSSGRVESGRFAPVLNREVFQIGVSGGYFSESDKPSHLVQNARPANQT